jgi:hypothetical protein
MRSLFLHVSALNDDEYTLFTSSFADLVATDPPLKPDNDFEKITVSIHEARAWLRGRYPDLPMSDLNQILRIFPTNPGHDATLVRGQFFTILRLVLQFVAEQSLTETSSLSKVRVHLSSSWCPALFSRTTPIVPFIGAYDCRALHRLVRSSCSPTVNPCLFCAGRASGVSRNLTGLCGVSSNTSDRFHLFNIVLTISPQFI